MSGEYDLEAGPDPATYAAVASEPAIEERSAVQRTGSAVQRTGRDDGGDTASTAPVYAVGIGPGILEYLTPRGRRAIQEADVIVGFSTVVAFVSEVIPEETEVLTCGYKDEAAALETFGERVAAGESGTAVLMGDPNHSGYQFLGKVQDAVKRGATNDPHPVRVIPGISSLQIAASRARTPMEDTEFVTLHKSGDLSEDMNRLATAVGDRHLLILPRPYDRMPGDIARFLLEAGGNGGLEALVLEYLTHDEEAIHRFSLEELATHAGGDGPEDSPFSDLSVLAVRREVSIE